MAPLRVMEVREPLVLLNKGHPGLYRGPLADAKLEDKDHQKRYTTEIVCENLILLSGRGGGGGGDQTGPPGEFDQSERPVSMPRSAQRPQPAASAPPAEDFSHGITDDDVPF